MSVRCLIEGCTKPVPDTPSRPLPYCATHRFRLVRKGLLAPVPDHHIASDTTSGLVRTLEILAAELGAL